MEKQEAVEPEYIQSLLDKLNTSEATTALSELALLCKKQENRKVMDNLLGDRTLVWQQMTDPKPKTRKNAAKLIGELGHKTDVQPLIAALSAEETMFVIPSILLSLGKLGGGEAKAALAAYEPPEPADESQVKHCAMIREAKQKALGAQGEKAPLPPYILDTPRQVLLVAPEGFSGLLCRELESLGYQPKQTKQGALVETAQLQKLYKARCFTELLLPLGTGIPLTPAAVAKVAKPFLTQPWRVELREYPGRRAGWIQSLNQCLGGGDDPSHYGLELRILCRDDVADVFLKPVSLPDGRFSYRKQTIAASIHPATGACLAKLALALWDGRRREAGDETQLSPKALDAFCGSGTLLIELEKARHCQELTGVDISPMALSAAKENAKAAHVPLTLIQKDARKFIVRQPYDILISNLPFGNRVGTHQSNEELYRQFVARLPELLEPDGVAILYTMERRLLEACVDRVPGLCRLQATRTEAGGLLPWAVALGRQKNEVF